jgi:AraC-like DNA-binding protein
MSVPGYRLLQKSFLSDCVFPDSARLGRQAATAGAILADMPWRSGSYTSPLTQRQCSKTASFRATATAALFFAFFPPRSQSRSHTKPLRVETLAEIARMGMSNLHHHFRALTAMSPLQYQKQLRLVAARERMLVKGIDAASSCYTGRSGPSRLSWLCFEDPQIIPDRKNSGQAKTRCLEKCSPFVLTSLSAAGNGQHVEITHQVAF